MPKRYSTPSTSSRKDVRDVAPAVLDALNRGERATGNLVAGLAMDFSVLLRAVVPDAGEACFGAMDAARAEGISRRMALAGSLLLERFSGHVSDTVRGA